MSYVRRLICYYKYSDKNIVLLLFHLTYLLLKKTCIMKGKFFDIWKKSLHKKYERYLRVNPEGTYLDFNGAKFPDVLNDFEKLTLLDNSVFLDTFYVSCYCGDNYDENLIKKLDKYFPEGPYCYQEKNGVHVIVEANDIVIDAGAWIGDFSAYAASKGACVYAFEPVKETYDCLCKTAKLNEPRIIPIKKGLGEGRAEFKISVNSLNSGSNSLLKDYDESCEMVDMTSLDEFVEEYKLSKVDFIKSDIEGFERYLLKGAKKTLAKYSPKLSICTYHFPEDPQLLEKLILEANPNYTVIQHRHKLVASVVKSNRV